MYELVSKCLRQLSSTPFISNINIQILGECVIILAYMFSQKNIIFSEIDHELIGLMENKLWNLALWIDNETRWSGSNIYILEFHINFSSLFSSPKNPPAVQFDSFFLTIQISILMKPPQWWCPGARFSLVHFQGTYITRVSTG